MSVAELVAKPSPLAGYDPTADADGYEYDAERARRAVDFFPLVLRHVKNSRFTRAGSKFELQPWQVSLIGNLFGWIDKSTGLRRYRTAYVEIPRKNGKSTIASGAAALGLYSDGEDGAECYCAASTRDQASLLFDIVAGMVRKSELLSKESKIRDSVKRIIYKDSYLRAVASDSHSLHGSNAHIVVADEVHAWQGGGHELWSVLETSTASRGQSIMLGLTTAGFDKTSKCWELHCHSKAIREGRISDPTFLPVVYGAEIDEDWRDPEVWARANPNLGITIPIEYLQQQCNRAQLNQSFQNTFRRLHLNQWTSQRTRWINMDAWDACHDPHPV